MKLWTVRCCPWVHQSRWKKWRKRIVTATGEEMRKGNNSRREKKCQPMRLNWSSQKRQQLSCTEQKLQEMRSYRPFHSFLPNECKYRKSPGGKQHTEETDVFIDSGATCNIVNRTSWENLRQRGVKCESCNCQENISIWNLLWRV